MQPHDGYVRGAARDIAARSVGRREAELDARAPAISVSEARHIQASEWPDAHALRRRATLWGERLGGGRCAHTRSPAGVSKPRVASREHCVSDLTRTS